MHIVFVSREYLPSKYAGGIASYLKIVSVGLVKSRHQVTVICASDDTRISSDSYIEGVRVIRLSGGDFIVPSIEGSSFIKKFRGRCRYKSYRKQVAYTLTTLENIDIVEFPDYGDEDLFVNFSEYTCQFVLRLHTPVVRSVKGLKNRIKKIIFPLSKIKERLLMYEHITACSNYLKGEYNLEYQIEKPIKVIYNPTDIVGVEKDKKTDIFQIAFAGTVTPSKGVGELLEATNSLSKEKQIKLTIAGRLSAWGNKIKEKYAKEDWCEFVGAIPLKNVLSLFANSDVVCLPSWVEPFGIVCIEAMMCESVVIASRKGGMNEIIADGEDGFLVDPNDSLQLVDKIRYVYSLSSEERLHIGMRAREKVLDKFSTNVIVPQMEAYYESLIINQN